MDARRVLPFLLIAGGVLMFMHRKRHEFVGQCEDGEPRRSIGPRHEWGRRVPPMFDAQRWHKRAHEQERQAQSAAI
jgi:hypothetical protein